MEDPRAVVRSLLEGHAGAPLPDWPSFASAIGARRASEGQTLLHEDDQVGARLYIVTSGVVHVRLVYPDGGTRTVNFARPGDFMASLPLIDDRPRRPLPTGGNGNVLSKALAAAETQRYRLLALTPTTYVDVPLREWQVRAHRNAIWGRSLSMAYLSYAHVMHYERDRMRLPAEQRYRTFIEDFAPLLTHIQQKDIADYLGVSVVGLSRIASRVRREGGTARSAGGAEPS